MNKQMTFDFNGQPMSVAGIGHLAEEDLISLFQQVGAAVGKKLRKRNVLSTWQAVVDYLRSQMAFERNEQFRILFLDKRNQLIADEVQQTGTVDHVPVYPREVMKRALEHHATALILAHNHPSGDPSPSRADISMTEELIKVGKMLGIAIHDHVIIGRDGHASLKALKLI